MSDAKWCDGCGSLFPAGIDGSETGVARITKMDNGKSLQLDQVRDWCPICVSLREKTTQVYSPMTMTRTIEQGDTSPH